MEKRYTHLSPEEREEISLGLTAGKGICEIARGLSRPASAVSREIRRNGRGGAYRASTAELLAQERARKPRVPHKLFTPWLWRYVICLLRDGWSPEQIAGRLRMEHPDDLSMRVSHETIYAAIYLLPRGELRKELIGSLRQARKKRLPRSRGTDRRGRIPNMTSIHARPEEVEGRLVPGHWEGDLIKGAHNTSAVGTLVERQTRFLIMARMDGTTAEAARRAYERRLKRVPEELRKSLTYDQGTEMSQHETLAQHLKIKVYFADPHSPWQRGTNENTNGLIRQYLPKGTDLSKYTQRDLNKIAERLNTRPRKSLGFYTPEEVYNKLLESQAVVALGG